MDTPKSEQIFLNEGDARKKRLLERRDFISKQKWLFLLPKAYS